MCHAKLKEGAKTVYVNGSLLMKGHYISLSVRPEEPPKQISEQNGEGSSRNENLSFLNGSMIYANWENCLH